MQPDKTKISLRKYRKAKNLFEKFRSFSKKETLKNSLVIDIDEIRRNLRRSLVIKQTKNGYTTKYA